MYLLKKVIIQALGINRKNLKFKKQKNNTKEVIRLQLNLMNSKNSLTIWVVWKVWMNLINIWISVFVKIRLWRCLWTKLCSTYLNNQYCPRDFYREIFSGLSIIVNIWLQYWRLQLTVPDYFCHYLFDIILTFGLIWNFCSNFAWNNPKSWKRNWIQPFTTV